MLDWQLADRIEADQLVGTEPQPHGLAPWIPDFRSRRGAPACACMGRGYPG
jgi:hypothetical protein